MNYYSSLSNFLFSAKQKLYSELSDVTTQAQILKLMSDLQEQFRMAIIIITHDMGGIAEVAVVYLGKVVETGPVYQSPAELSSEYHGKTTHMPTNTEWRDTLSI